MNRRLLALSLPLAACLLVAVAVVVTLAVRSSDVPGSNHAAADSNEDARVQTPRFTPESNVCQGILHRPDAGAARIFSPEYTQRREAKGIIIVGNATVDEKAMDEAAKTVTRFFANNDLETLLAAEGAYVIVAAGSQGVLDLPEFRCMDSAASQELFSHVCGVADRADYPVVTVNERDLLGRRDGPCAGLNILYHELGHLVQGWTLGPADYIDVRLFYQDALNAGKYRRDYAATNSNEYFASATQAYFLHTDAEGQHGRDWLREYDPQIYALVERVYGD
ncbi:MAG: hypothetical protein IT301_13020 [Dehalococcoidia bacterium]|nr:hypothetical protein [Dehalococcoidia bacterium]